jgi:hypothetical protein
VPPSSLLLLVLLLMGPSCKRRQEKGRDSARRQYVEILSKQARSRKFQERHTHVVRRCGSKLLVSEQFVYKQQKQQRNLKPPLTLFQVCMYACVCCVAFTFPNNCLVRESVCLCFCDFASSRSSDSFDEGCNLHAKDFGVVQTQGKTAKRYQATTASSNLRRLSGTMQRAVCLYGWKN